MSQSNISTTTSESAPSPSIMSAFRGLSSHGFLDYIGEVWKEKGDCFRLNLGVKSLLIVIHPDAVHHVNVGRHKNYDKLKSYDSVRKYLMGDGLVSSRGELWQQQRKLMSPFFTPKGVQEYASIMLRDATNLVQRWEQFAESGVVVDMEEEMMRITASIIIKTIFSSEMDGDTMEMKECVSIMIRYASEKQRGVVFPDWVPTKKNCDYFRSKVKVQEYIDRIIQQRRALPEEEWPKDVLTKLMQTKDEETGAQMSEKLLKDESITAFIAGHETTAITMSAAWYVLARQPTVRAKLNEELDRVLGDRLPTLKDLYDLPYTLQVVKEVLRLYPAAPFYARDAVDEDVIQGYRVPKGTPVMLSPYYTHRHPDFWENPLEFDPDRWEPEREKARHRYAYHPFATGKRICIGNNFSLLESQILLATLAQKYSPRLALNATVTWEMQGTLGTTSGIPMVIERKS